jgi:LysM repeat protein
MSKPNTEEAKARVISFKDTGANTELVLPVTPESFEVSHGISIETVNIHTLGDVAVAGYETLPSFQISCIFPARDYPFNQPSANTADPYGYVRKFEDWCDSRTVLRFIVSGTMVNVPVLISEITYGEKDGTGDVYAAVGMRKYRQLSAARTDKTGNGARSAEAPAKDTGTYRIEPGDTLYAICRKKYGDPTLCAKLANYNNIPNPNLIRAGAVLTIPDKSLL